MNRLWLATSLDAFRVSRVVLPSKNLSDWQVSANTLEPSLWYGHRDFRMLKSLTLMTASRGSGVMILDIHARVDALNMQAWSLLTTNIEKIPEIIAEARNLALEVNYKIGFSENLIIEGKYNVLIGNLNDAVANFLQAKKIFEIKKNQKKLLQTLICLSETYRDLGNLKLSVKTADQAILVSQQIGDKNTEADALNLRATLSNHLGEYVFAIEKLKKVLNIRVLNSDLRGQASTLMNIGTIYTNLSNYVDGLQYLLESYKLIKNNLNDYKIEAQCLLNIGNLYQDIKNYKFSINYYNKSLKISEKNKDFYTEIGCLNNLGESYYFIENYQKSIQVFEKALEKSKKYGLKHLEIFILDGIGKTYSKLGNYQKSVSFQQKSLELADQSGDLQCKINALIGLGDSYFGLQDNQTAIEYFLQSLDLSNDIKQPKTAYEAHQKLADVYQRTGDLAKVIEHLREYHRLEREVFNQETAQKTKNLSLQFDLERARHETEVYRVQNETIERANDLLEHKVQERTQELEAARAEVVMRLAIAAEYRDDNTGQHTLRVGRTSALIGEILGLPADLVELLRSAARLHDVGKIGITDLILLKPGKLTNEEFDLMKTHTTIGAQMLSNGQSLLLKMAETIALTHHERWDGRGYPKGLAGEDIPLVGRIVAVADVFDALRSERPYKTPWTLEETRAEIEAQAGKQFDAQVVEAFIKLLDSGENFN